MKTANGSLDCLFAHTPISECGGTPYYLLASVWPLLIVIGGLLAIVVVIGYQTFTRPINWDVEPKDEKPEDRARNMPF